MVANRGETNNSVEMNTKLDVMELINRCPGAIISIGAADLRSFARQLIAESRREFERERIAIEAGKAENYLEPETVKSMLKISESTLYRMAKSKILEPVWIAGQKRFRQSDIERIVRSSQA